MVDASDGDIHSKTAMTMFSHIREAIEKRQTPLLLFFYY
ncbi:hypothetical protein CCACVL1_03919 [Corchorus capsularis]|uniref:Uncharacterized protein n=1 Tax=Corchorus capsularis TaxID=210143 RepID=A0A1R3JWA4_COCAP|nr:hypothetical protein CCACVL1_03919 [Corchorus capsularis]